MNKKKRLFLIILTLLVAVLVAFSAVACKGKTTPEEPDEPVNPTVKKLTQNEALDKIFNGLTKGKKEMSQATAYGVVNVFDLYLETVVNYRITYKANYKENAADSEIYLSVFDYDNNMERVSFLYDGGDLYISSGEDKSVVKAFGSSMLFGSFYEGCKRMDMTGRFYDEKQIAAIFNRSESVNLGMILSQNNITYNKVGESGEAVELADLDLTIVNDNLSFFFENTFRGIDDKFDLVSKKFLGFRLSRLIETRFSHIYAKSITMTFEDSAVKGSEWVSDGTLQGNVHKFKIGAAVSYNDGATVLPEKTALVKSKYPETNVGRNDFEGKINIPDVSDQDFDLNIETDINVNDNSLNRLNVRVTDATKEEFASLYYVGGTAYLDASGFYRWLDGAVDLNAFNLPKVYLENLDLSKLLAAGYNNLAKVLLVLVRNGFSYGGDDETKALYETIMENFSDNGVDTIYYTITEELIKKIRNDDESMMSIVAKALGIEEKQLASYIGEDFFTSAKLVIGYNLETEVITLTFYQKEKVVFIATLFANDYNGVFIPGDCNKESAAYSLIKYPETATVEINANVSLTSGRQVTDASRVFGAFIGDESGANTPYSLHNGETLVIKGTVTQSIVDENAPNFVSFDVYSKIKSNSSEKLVLSVRSNPRLMSELLVSYYAKMGDYDNPDGIFYRIDRKVVIESFDAILGKENIFNESNVLSILTKILGFQGSAKITKANGWFEMSLLSEGENDPVNALIGIKDCTAQVRMRAVFDGVDDDVDASAFVTPSVTPLDSVTVESIYSKGSAWKTAVEVTVKTAKGSKTVTFTPTYAEDTVKIETGKSVYHPVAKLFGEEISYELRITGSEGTYKIADIYDRTLVIDPTLTKKLPTEIKVRYDNNVLGYLPCEFTGFEESNITLAGYNLAGFAEDYGKCVKSKVTIGVDSIMNKEYDIYILVNNRKVLPAKDASGGEMFDNTGVPVVGTVEIDPYTYAMTKSENPSYNPVTALIESKGLTLYYDNVYGEETVLEGDTEVTKKLTYDIFGVNKFVLSELDLNWDYDLSKITWQGSLGYAYATIGDEAGYPIKIAVKVIVSARTFDYIKIDDEENGRYTIDFLQKETYSIPSQSGVRHDVYIYFYSDDASTQKRRKLVAARPDGISDIDYYENYALGSLDWEGAEYITKNPTVITVNGTNNLFGFLGSGRSGNATKATFGDAMIVGEQEVRLEINVPTRYQSSQNMREESVATGCVVDESGIPQFIDITPVRISPAKFTDNSDFYAPYEINPYDAAARLPSTVFLKVANSSAAGDGKFSDDLGNYEVKEYVVEWVTTDDNGKELNLIERKDDGLFGLKNPVVYRQDFVVYGKIGDRGGDDLSNIGYVWVRMAVRNLASKLADIRFDGLEEGETEITIDPYASYSLPNSFTARLESGKVISQDNMEWYVSVRNANEWFPINYKQGYDSRYYDEAGKYIFSYEGGRYELRYILDGGAEVIKQEIILLVTVPERKLVVNSDGRNLVDIFDGSDFAYGYNRLNTYEEYSSVLIERLEKIKTDGYVSVAFSSARNADGSYVPYRLAVRWTAAEEGHAGYENSIDRLIAALKTSPDGKTIELKGSVYAGTINEQVVTLGFSFVRLKLKEISLDRFYVALENEAANVEEMDGSIALSDIASSGKIHLNITKAFGLKNEEGKFASPYDYINYLFGEIQLGFENGSVLNAVPALDFCGYDRDTFNNKVLNGDNTETSSEYTDVEIKLTKLSRGSALQEIKIAVRTLKDERLESGEEIVAELFDEQSEELFGENKDYALPTSIKVRYKLSGDVIYDTPIWTVGATTRPYLNADTATGIPVRFINTLRRDGNAGKQPSSYDFGFRLPCEDASYNITVRIPRKDIGGTKYSATDETGLYRITEGVLNIDNPYLYYSADSEYGMDVTKIPSVITAEITSEYESTELNTHYVEWNFIKGVFDSSKFADGLDRVKFATATLKAYYDADGNRQTQTVDLYITVKSLVYYGISYGELPVKEGADGNKNVITIDPYDDVMGYKGDFRLPTIGLTVLFNAGLDNFVFGDKNNPVTFKLFDNDGNVLNENLVNVPYTEKGHALNYEALKGVTVLTIKAYIPGYENGLPLYLDIQSRNIEKVSVGNYKFDKNGTLIGTEHLDGVYFVDPYNSATFMLPSEVSVKFRENTDYTTQKVAGWEIIGDDGNPVSLESDKNFYVRNDYSDAVSYGFYRADGESYKGKNYKLRGYISLGRTSTGTAGRQYFTIDAIVLNRSLKEEFSTHYRYDDPLGGLLSDIPGSLTEEMFVDYDRYYAKLDLPDGYEYSAWNYPVVPKVNWGIENDDSIIDYKGGFDKDIKGNVYYADVNASVLLGILSAKINASYENLIKARMWDGYFTSSGAPQAYSSATSSRLRALKAEFDKEVIKATYDVLLAKYNAGDESERQFANYLANTLVNEIIAEYGYNRLTEFNEIAYKMFDRVKDSSETGSNETESAIYLKWKEVYDAFVAENDEYKPDLSAYQLLKVAKYDVINDESRPVFTIDERNGINARLRARIEASLRIYVNADIWDALYDRALEQERKIMSSLVKGNSAAAKSSALGVFRVYEALPGSVGEFAFANITAPSLDVGKIIEKYDESGNPVYKTEFIFNVYSSLSFVEDADVEISLNQYPVLKKYVEEGIRLAMEDIRQAKKGEALSAYIARVTEDYVNSIVPTRILPDQGGAEEKVIDFTYVYGSFAESSTAYAKYWDTLYKYAQDSAVAHIDLLPGNTTQEKWAAAYRTHEIRKDGMCEIMEEIQARNGENFTKMFEEYAEVLQKRATAEMDGYLAEATSDANVKMADYIMEGNTKVSSVTNSYGGSQGAFAIMFDEIGNETYDRLKKSYSSSEDLTVIERAYNAAQGGNGTSKAMAAYYLMKNTNVTTAMRDRAENIFYYLLGGAAAYEIMVNNASAVGLTATDIELLYNAAATDSGSLSISRYNGAFTEEEFAEYRKTAFVKSLMTSYKGSSNAAVVAGWISAAIRTVYSTGYEKIAALKDDYVTLRETECGITRNAFVKYVKAYESKGNKVKVSIKEKTEYYQNKYVFDNSENIVEKLLNGNTFSYKNELLVTDPTEIRQLKADALDYYLNAYADSKTANAINYFVYLYGGDAFDKLSKRDDLGSKFIADLNNAYYYVLLEKAKNNIREKLVVTDADKQTTRYKNLYEEVRNRFDTVAVAPGSLANSVQTAMMEAAVNSQYLAIKYSSVIQAYTEEVRSLVSASEKAVNGFVYDDIYGTDAAIFDEINAIFAAASDSLYSEAYKYFRQKLIENEASFYYDAADDVKDAEAKNYAYGLLDSYAFKTVDEEDVASSFVNKVFAEYELLTDEEKASVSAIVGDAFTAEITYYEKAEKLFNIYVVLKKNVDGSISSVADRLASAIENAAVIDSVSDTDKAVTEGIRTSVGQILYKDSAFLRKYNLTVSENVTAEVAAITGVETYAVYLELIKTVCSLRGNINGSYLSDANNAGDFSVTSEEYNAAYTDILASVLKNGVGGKVLGVSYDVIKAAIDGKADEIKSELNAGNYSRYGEKIIGRMLLTSAHSDINAGEEPLTVGEYIASKTSYVDEIILKRYVDGAVGSNDNERKKNIFELTKQAYDGRVKFKTEDHAVSEDDNRKVIVFDKSALVGGSGSSVKAPVYIGNKYKITSDYKNAYKIDSIDYRYIQVVIKYVDFTDTATADTIATFKDRNYIEIDPFAPEFPDTVHAYGEYQATGSSETILFDVGYVNVSYGDVFKENIYDGQDKETVSYFISLTDKQGQTYSLSVATKYFDRTIKKIYVDTDVYGGEKVADLTSDFNGLTDMSDETGVNKFIVNPINESLLDVEKKSYVLPETLTAAFADGTYQKYDEVEWDLASVEYSLVGRKGIKLRLLGYVVKFDDGTSRKVSFDYEKNTVTVVLRDENGNATKTKTYNNVPDEKIWNMTLDVTDQTPKSIIVENVDGTRDVIGTLAANGAYIDISKDKYTLNPFDVVFPPEYKIVFSDGTESSLIEGGGWKLEVGANGTYKMQDIIMGVAGDHNVMTEFGYLGYRIRARIVADDIELDGLADGEYYDGGTLYLVKGGGSVFEQLERNYSYFYYNFSNVSGRPDYRKVPLSFIDANISSISTENETVYRDVKGVLGWDKKAYPGGITMSPNILFTIAVIDPQMYAKYDGATNRYVVVDYLGMPYDGNYQKKNDVNEPAIADYLVKIATNGEEIKFYIDRESINYNVLQKTVTFECVFRMTSGEAKLFADKDGGKNVSFSVTMPLSGYLYTGVRNAEFDRTPVKNAKGEDIWQWTAVSEDSLEYRDGIIWELGKELKASYLPKAITASGEKISLLWNLDGINVNASTADSAKGSYIAKGYYYNSDGAWVYKELAISVEKFDTADTIIDNLGGSTTLISVYDGKYYKLPLDLNSEGMYMLRKDGSYGPLNETALTVEYKAATDEDRKYSATNYPLNAGEYDVRVRIDDDNVTVSGELVFRLIRRAVTINQNNVTFVGESSNTVIYTYDGTRKELVVKDGLPTVVVDNWFGSAEEKQEILNRHLADGYDETTAKSRAYNELYNRVTPQTREYLDDKKDALGESTGYENDALNAAMFDRLTPNLEICEVVADVTYVSGNSVLKEAPTEVGVYTVNYTVKAEQNRGNYVFNKNTTLSRIIEIVQPSVNYGLAETELKYNGLYQNPRISGLHDEKGNLPAGVTVTYKYSTGVGSSTQYFTDGIKNAGVYNCSVEIDGGKNYPNGSIANQQVYIVAGDLYIDIERASGEYLSAINDVKDKVVFNGLKGNDDKSLFGDADIYTEAKEYFVPGTYGIYLRGFVMSGAQSVYTSIDLTETFVVNGKNYYRMYLKPASEEGSLYRQLDSAGNYVYAEIIALIGTKDAPGNYKVYVAEKGEYNIYVNTTGDEKIYVVDDDAGLNAALNGIKDGDKARIYLNAKDGVKTVYSGIEINVNAVVYLIGCYDADKNILTYLDSLKVVKGAANVRIIGFEADAEGEVTVEIGRGAGAVTIEDCVFNGNGQPYSVGIRTEDGYEEKLLCTSSVFNGFQIGLIAYGGNMEIIACEFGNNVRYGVRIDSDGKDIQIGNCTFVGNNVGLYFENKLVNVRDNTFSANRTAIEAPGGDEIDLSSRNEIDDKNGVKVKV